MPVGYGIPFSVLTAYERWPTTTNKSVLIAANSDLERDARTEGLM
jgi:hypothetical protein